MFEGEIDLSTSGCFREQLHEVIDGTSGALVFVDFSDITFIGSAGYREVLGATSYAKSRDQLLVIQNPSLTCRRLFDLIGEYDFRVETDQGPIA